MADNETDSAPKKEIPNTVKIALFIIFIAIAIGIVAVTHPHIFLGKQGQPGQQQAAPQGTPAPQTPAPQQ